MFLSESFYADGLAALMPQTTISAVVCRIEMASINIVYGTAEGLRRNLPTTGPWQMEQHAQAHTQKKTFNNPLLALGRAPSPRFGRFLPKEATPLSDPHLEPFTSLTSNNWSNHRRLWRAPALPQHFLFVPRLMRELKHIQARANLTFGNTLPSPLHRRTENKQTKQKANNNKKKNHLNRSGRKQDFFPLIPPPLPFSSFAVSRNAR